MNRVHELDNATISFEVRYKGFDSGHFSPSGYSKYNERFTKFHKGELGNEMIYGIKQAKEHVKEIRESLYEGKAHLADKQFYITRVRTVRHTYLI